MQIAFPFDLLQTKEQHRALVKGAISKSGKVIHTEIIENTSPEFGYAVQAAYERIGFMPARKGDEPLSTYFPIEVQVKYDTLPEKDRETAERLLVGKLNTVPIAELDQPLRAIIAGDPVHPRALASQGIEGSAEVEYVILPDGRACLPRIVESSRPEFGHALAAAVATYRFSPPKKDGKTVHVLRQVAYEFLLPKD